MVLWIPPAIITPSAPVAWPEITFRASGVVPPIRTSLEDWTSSSAGPLTFAFPAAETPSAVRPIRLPWTTARSPPTMLTPTPSLPEITFPAPVTAPPMWTSLTDWALMPEPAFGSEVLPSAARPITFPSNLAVSNS